MRNTIWLLGAMLLSACGPAGVISGRATVEGGSAAGIVVVVFGPQSAATVTGDDGTFGIGNLPDGKYVVRATLRGADVEELNAQVTVTQGKSSPEPMLAFKASTARVTGKVVMADGSGPENLTVTATGPEIRGARTSPDGSFTFEGLKTGAYVISVELKDTREGRVAVGVNASGPTDAGELRLTPVGRINGTVVYNALPVAGAPVVITGSNVSSVTDAMGQFQLVDVPTGNQAVSVRVGTAPFFRSVTAMVTVARGANADLPLVLTDDMPKTGTVTGTVTFHGPRTPRDITVSAPGSGVTAVPQINGAYQLALPVGVWDVVANAPQHPTKLLGRVTVVEGQAQSLPGAEVSWYRPMWRSSSQISSPATVTVGGQNDTVPWSLVTFFDNASRLALVNSTTYDFRILAAGTTSGHRISKAGKYAGWFVNQTVFVYEIATATLSTFSTLTVPSTPVLRIEFSSDESALFIQRSGPVGTAGTLTRVKFSAPSTPETFPPTGNAVAIQLSSVDRWFVQEGTTVRLVNPAINVPDVFTQVSNTWSAVPTAWAVTNCTMTCELWVLSPTSTTTAVRDMGINPAPGTLISFTSYGFDHRGEYPCFSVSGTSAFCVKSADGMHIPLFAHPARFRLNEAGDRAVWTFNMGATGLLREEAMPPSLTTANLGSSPAGWNIGWLSPTRAYGYEALGGPRTLHLVKAGMDTIDADLGAGFIIERPPLLVFPQSTTSQWRAYLGDGPVRSIPVATNLPVTSSSVRLLGTGLTAATRFAAVSYDQTSAYIIDELAGSVRQTAAGFAGGLAGRSGPTEWFDLQRVGGSAARGIYVFNSNALLEYNEASSFVATLSVGVGGPGVLAFLGLSEDSRTIEIGGFQP